MSDWRAELESMRALLAPGGAWYGCGEEYLRNAMSARLALLVDTSTPTSRGAGWWHPADEDHNCRDDRGSIIGWREWAAPETAELCAVLDAVDLTLEAMIARQTLTGAVEARKFIASVREKTTQPTVERLARALHEDNLAAEAYCNHDTNGKPWCVAQATRLVRRLSLENQ